MVVLRARLTLSLDGTRSVSAPGRGSEDGTTVASETIGDLGEFGLIAGRGPVPHGR